MLLLVLAAVVLERLPCERDREDPFAVAPANRGRRSSSPSPPRLLEREDAVRLRTPREGVDTLRLLALWGRGERQKARASAVRRSCILEAGKANRYRNISTTCCAGEVLVATKSSAVPTLPAHTDNTKRGTPGNVLGREYIAETIKKQIAMPRRQQRTRVNVSCRRRDTRTGKGRRLRNSRSRHEELAHGLEHPTTPALKHLVRGLFFGPTPAAPVRGAPTRRARRRRHRSFFGALAGRRGSQAEHGGHLANGGKNKQCSEQ